MRGWRSDFSVGPCLSSSLRQGLSCCAPQLNTRTAGPGASRDFPVSAGIGIWATVVNGFCVGSEEPIQMMDFRRSSSLFGKHFTH